MMKERNWGNGRMTKQDVLRMVKRPPARLVYREAGKSDWLVTR